MAFPNDQWFLDAFVTYNKNRYKDQPHFVDSLNTLTLDEVTFQNRRKNTGSSGTPFYLVDMSSPQLFVASDQQYAPGDYIADGPSSLVDETPLDLATLERRFVPGIYKIQVDPNTVAGAVLVKAGEKNQANILQLVQDSCLYTLQNTEVTIDSGLTVATIDSNTVIGSLTIVESTNTDNAAHYDGDFFYDGTLTY
jgi:hypothetical protein